jgi:hypothetical protein
VVVLGEWPEPTITRPRLIWRSVAEQPRRVAAPGILERW